jgi:hypothetical protein
MSAGNQFESLSGIHLSHTGGPTRPQDTLVPTTPSTLTSEQTMRRLHELMTHPQEEDAEATEARKEYPDDYYKGLPPTAEPKSPQDEKIRYAAESIKGIIGNFVSGSLQGLIPPDREILALHKIGAGVDPRRACVNRVAVITRNGQIKEGLIPEDEYGKWNFERIEHIDEAGNTSPGFTLARDVVTVKHAGTLAGKLFNRLRELKSTMEASGTQKAELTRIKSALDMRNKVENAIMVASKDIAPDLLIDRGDA